MLNTFTEMAEQWLRENLAGMDAPTPTPMVNASPVPDPAEWESKFSAWAKEECVYRDHCWGGIGCLWVHFCQWCDRNGSVGPSSRATFEAILRDQGLEFMYPMERGLVYGLILREDAEANQKYNKRRS